MNKAEIRKQAMLKRNELSVERLQDLSKKLLQQFMNLDFSTVRTIHMFLPILSKKEPDTFLILDWLQANHPEIAIVVPKADFKTSLMTHHFYKGSDSLMINSFDIPEPADGFLFDGNIDMVILPLLAFDHAGYRVGYGKGFYDRFLDGLDVLKIGLSLFGPVDTITDIHGNDKRLDLCLTPDEIFYFTDQASSSNSTGQ